MIDSTICTVRLVIDERIELHLVLTDPKEIKELVLDPIGEANVDRVPMEYESVGEIIIETDGDAERIVLFFPVGRILRGGRYYVANLDGLIIRIEDMLASIKVINARTVEAERRRLR